MAGGLSALRRRRQRLRRKSEIITQSRRHRPPPPTTRRRGGDYLVWNYVVWIVSLIYILHLFGWWKGIDLKHILKTSSSRPTADPSFFRSSVHWTLLRRSSHYNDFVTPRRSTFFSIYHAFSFL